MISSRPHGDIEVSCPDCTLSFETSLDVIEESQRLLDTYGYCTGLASFECPAPYFAGLAVASTRSSALEPELARWENEGGAVRVMQSPAGDVTRSS